MILIRTLLHIIGILLFLRGPFITAWRVDTNQRNGNAFAALKQDGSVVTWGGSDDGGDSSTVSSSLTSILQIYPGMLCSLKTRWSCSCQGYSYYGGDSSTVSSSLTSNVQQIYSTLHAFAALKQDGSVVTWGDSNWGGDSSTVSSY